MKFIIIISIIMSLSLSNKISTFKVDGMMCVNGCVWKVNSVTESINGVYESSVDFEKSVLTVKYDSLKVNDKIIIKELLNQTTYKVITSKDDLIKKRKTLDLLRKYFR